MQTLRIYGNQPFNVAVLHGGPGAPGEMAPVARELSSIRGVLEPLQIVSSLQGQVMELRIALKVYGNPPVTLIGWSWGAMLGFIFTASHPSFVKKLILISSGVYEEKYSADIMKTRLRRLKEEERTEVLSLMEALDNPAVTGKNTLMARLGELIFKADSYEPLPHVSEVLECQYEVYRNVWEQARKLRASGELLSLGRKIKCPVVAIHGDYDPHPPEGIRDSLSCVLRDFRFILLEKCGHYPWLERADRDRFYDILKNEIE